MKNIRVVGPRGEVYVVPAPGPRIRIEFHQPLSPKGEWEGKTEVGWVVVGELSKEDGGNLC